MDDNPYQSPGTRSELLPREPRRARFRPGGLLFVALGLVFVLLPAGAVVAAFTDAKTPRTVVGQMAIGSALLVLLGLLLVVHGWIRSRASIAVIAFFLVALLFLVMGLVATV